MKRRVLLHGFAGSPAAWEPIAARLREHDEVLALRITGHAFSPATSASFVDEVDRLAAEIQANGFAGAQLAGYSLGGRLALGLACRHAGLISRLILIGAHPGLAAEDPMRAERVASDEAWARKLEDQGMASFEAAWATQPIFASQLALAEPVQAQQRALRLGHEAAGLAHAMRVLSLGRMPDWSNAYAQLRVPIDLLVGQADTKFLALAQRMQAINAQARLTVAPNAGHNLLLEAPELVLSRLLDDSSQR